MEGIQREVSGLQIFSIFITSVSLDNWATFPLLPAGCRTKGRVLKEGWGSRSSSFDMQMWLSDRKKNGGKDVYFLHQQLIHFTAFCERKTCPLTVTSVAFSVKKPPWFSHTGLRHSVLTSTSRFYWLRELIPVRQNCPKLYQQFGFSKSLWQHPWSLLLWLEGKGAHSKAAFNQITWGAPGSKPALQVEKEHWTLRNVCGMLSLWLEKHLWWPDWRCFHWGIYHKFKGTPSELCGFTKTFPSQFW